MRRTLVTAAALTASLACASMALGGTISGQVFRDYNSNGAKNAGGFVSGSSVTATASRNVRVARYVVRVPVTG
ncbi:MAG: hypothetical protein KGQ95_06575 [Acidobacteria bacterium]|nr:hypothetical protein [Acidobacteriota bacterium]